MGYSKLIKACIQEYLDGINWRYSFDEEQGVFKMGVNMSGKLKSCDISILVRENYYILYAGISLSADEGCMNAISGYIHRVNYGLRFGSFEFDLRDGEIRYKMCVDCGKDCDCLPSESVVERSVNIPIAMLEKYGDGLLGIMFAGMTAEDAIKMAEA